MPKAKLDASRFTPTNWDTAEDKAKFVQQFKAFVLSDFSDKKFPKWFYTRLSMTFGHIAHFNQGGFFGTFFCSAQDRVMFLRQTLAYGCYGDPKFTYGDAEREIQEWLRERGTLAEYERRFKQDTEQRERALLADLKAKYEPA
jgi:hypothetical protein